MDRVGAVLGQAQAMELQSFNSNGTGSATHESSASNGAGFGSQDPWVQVQQILLEGMPDDQSRTMMERWLGSYSRFLRQRSTVERRPTTPLSCPRRVRRCLRTLSIELSNLFSQVPVQVLVTIFSNIFLRTQSGSVLSVLICSTGLLFLGIVSLLAAINSSYISRVELAQLRNAARNNVDLDMPALGRMLLLHVKRLLQCASGCAISASTLVLAAQRLSSSAGTKNADALQKVGIGMLAGGEVMLMGNAFGSAAQHMQSLRPPCSKRSFLKLLGYAGMGLGQSLLMASTLGLYPQSDETTDEQPPTSMIPLVTGTLLTLVGIGFGYCSRWYLSPETPSSSSHTASSSATYTIPSRSRLDQRDILLRGDMRQQLTQSNRENVEGFVSCAGNFISHCQSLQQSLASGEGSDRGPMDADTRLLLGACLSAAISEQMVGFEVISEEQRRGLMPFTQPPPLSQVSFTDAGGNPIPSPLGRSNDCE